MLRLVAVAAAFLVLGFAVGRLSNQLAVNAEGRGAEEPCATSSGDANGDGAVNLSDAVFTLNSLFLGGPAIAPLCPSTGGKGLPATGQAKCYSPSGGELDCASPDFRGQDGFYQAGCPNEGRFVDAGDGTVTDSCTGLMWQRDTADVNGDGQVSDAIDGGDIVVWENALKYCEELSFAGHDDWRLPNIRELLSLVDYGRSRPAIHPVFGVMQDEYWSSSTYDPWPLWSWIVSFLNGTVEIQGIGKSLRFYVRAVRGGR